MPDFPKITVDETMEEVRDSVIKTIRETYAPLGITHEISVAIFAGIFYASMQALDAMFLIEGKERIGVKALQREIIQKIDDLLTRSFKDES